MPFGMKRAVRASRKYVNVLHKVIVQHKSTFERHPSLLHLTPFEIFQISILSNERR